MAGGEASDIRAPYPDGPFLLTFGPHDVPDPGGAAADKIMEQIYAPFKFRPVRAEVSAHLVTDADSSFKISLFDDTATAQYILGTNTTTGLVVTATARGAGLCMQQDGGDSTFDDTITINAGAKLSFEYTAGNGDVVEGLVLRLWVKPMARADGYPS
jgi:hypothetical protein